MEPGTLTGLDTAFFAGDAFRNFSDMQEKIQYSGRRWKCGGSEDEDEEEQEQEEEEEDEDEDEDEEEGGGRTEGAFLAQCSSPECAVIARLGNLKAGKYVSSMLGTPVALGNSHKHARTWADVRKPINRSRTTAKI